jgi:hypothetical protein
MDFSENQKMCVFHLFFDAKFGRPFKNTRIIFFKLFVFENVTKKICRHQTFHSFLLNRKKN